MLNKTVFGASLILLIIASVLFYIHIGQSRNFVIVGFDSYRGINFLGTYQEAEGILLTGFAIALINMILAAVFSHRDRFLARLLPFATLFISLLILITVGVIIVNN